MIWMLQHGQVEIRESSAPVTVDGKTYPSGSYVVLTKQPFGGYAKALLERQKYPNLFDYPGGPPKRPYDVTAHTLPLLFGVETVALSGALPTIGAVLPRVPEPAYRAPIAGNAKRIALYKRSTQGNMDEGWTRWVLDTWKVPYTRVTEQDIASGKLSSFDALILPDQNGNQI